MEPLYKTMHEARLVDDAYNSGVRAERARLRKEVEGLKRPSEHHFHPDGEDNKFCELANCKWNAALQAVLALLNS